jgi:hypothetical protein
MLAYLPKAITCQGKRVRKGDVKMGEKFHFPKFHYYLDESDPDIVILRRQDDSFVAAFSASGATREGILEAAKEDYRKLLQAHPDYPREATKEDRCA